MDGEEYEDPHCQGCQKPIDDGSVVQFGDGIWHFECFRCSKCDKLVECYSNLLLLRDGSPICEDCSYSCHACSKTIKDEAIMTGDEAYHADCFRCVQCDKKIEDLVFTQTSKGIYCTSCYEARKLQRMKRKDQKNERAPTTTTTTTRPSPPTYRASSTTSIVNAYTDDIPILASNGITELNDILSCQRSSEEAISAYSDLEQQLDQLSEADQIRNLKRELSDTKSKLKDINGKFNKIKSISRKALDEFRTVKEGYASEVQARKDADIQLVRIKSELKFYQQANIFHSHDFIHFNKEEIEELKQTRADLEQLVHELRSDRDTLVSELEKISKKFNTGHSRDLHWERLQHAYQQQLDSLQKDISQSKSSYTRLIKGREDIISDMLLLNSKNAELTQLNNNLSRRVMEREQEAKALFAGTNFLNDDTNGTTDTAVSSTSKHKRNLSTGSIPPAPETAKVAQRDSFNGSAAPKLFKFRRNKSVKHNNKNSDQESTRKHHFAQAKFIMPVKCEGCGEKMRRVNELKCSECGVACHSKCMYSVPQTCHRNNMDGDSEGYMFGVDLIKQIQSEKGKIPLIVEKCVSCVEERGMDYEGIYRKSGGVGQMRQIQQAFEKGEVPNLNDEERWNDICAVTSVLKQYFRELPNPLFTHELHTKFIDAIGSPSDGQLQTIAQLIQTLPTENFDTLHYLMKHLNRVQQRNKENLMTSKNLAVIFGPTLLRHQDENRDLMEMNHKINIIEFILNHVDTLFVTETTVISSIKVSTSSDRRRAHVPPQREASSSSLNSSYQDSLQVPAAAVPPRPNANYI